MPHRRLHSHHQTQRHSTRPGRSHADQQGYRPQPGYPPERRDHDDDDDWERSSGQPKRKRGMLGDLFDF